MKNFNPRGPKFQIESDRAMIILGHSERAEVGEFLASTLDARRIFEDIDVVTLNSSASLKKRGAMQRAMKAATVITHSAGIIRVPEALQVVAFNPPESVSFGKLLKRAMEIAGDPIEKEDGCHKTGTADMVKAGLQLAGSPAATLNTMIRIASGFSTVDRLVEGSEDFPAGRAIVHSELDGFGFADLADLDKASRVHRTNSEQSVARK